MQRCRVIRWLSQLQQGHLDQVMLTALQVSSSLTGSYRTHADVLDNSNRWSRVKGARSGGRWAVGSRRTFNASASDSALATLGEGPPPSSRRQLKRQDSFDMPVGEVCFICYHEYLSFYRDVAIIVTPVSYGLLVYFRSLRRR